MQKIDRLSINTIRTLSIDAIEKANSGHPGLPMGAAPMSYVLWQNHMRHNPENTQWADRDRFVLSAGHGSMLLYSLMHLYGYDLSLEDLKNFRQWNSKTPGHPETFMTAGVEATTGPLGQGSANAVGMALAERALAHRYNRPGFEIVNHFTYALVSDGDLMEGLSAEAGSLSGHLELGKLIYLYDSNDITLDGPTDLTFSEDIAKRYESYGWHVQTVRDGDTDLTALDQAITNAKKATSAPSLIIVKTTIGFGSPNKAGSSSAHGSPLGKEETAFTKKNLEWEWDAPFFVPQEAKENFQTALEKGKSENQKWDELFKNYEKKHPELAKEWLKAQKGELPEGWDKDLPTWRSDEQVSTRKASGKVLNQIAKNIPYFLGGDADLSVSTNTALDEAGRFEGQNGSGKNIHYGVREHAMASIANGIAYHGGLINFVATFFCFSDYMRPSIRLSALNHLPVIYVWTHDSIALGEDGPTHQPVEHLMSLRVMPGFTLIRPGDAEETREAWKRALLNKNGPTGIVLTRQDLPVFHRKNSSSSAEWLHQGAYILSETEYESPKLILIATGSEVSLAIEAQKELEEEKIPTRVVSMPSWELFQAQDQGYKDKVLPKEVRARVAIEAGTTLGWERWVGDQGAIIGLDRFGASAPGPLVLEKFGFTVENVIAKAKAVLKS
jgi:transketolase